MKMKKSDVIGILIIVGIYALIFSNVLQTASVQGVSMYPVLQNGSLTFYKSSHNATYHDIVIYRSPLGFYVIHRVVGETRNTYITQGVDNITNPIPDNRIGLEPINGISKQDVVGRVMEVDGYVISIPYLGYISVIFSSII
ncbi:signal peptidase I [Sulfuracidifex metallicus]|jgi:signal peptidase|uniref:Signal peptidase I n=1 Tax=Sulfuracidifex metallicus DSM 6482 = JCM 9184 TaxID=523847 RepID=A0A6A9QGV6_SULME|nr:signal peptidase I [Sulfuracidifex metallicus]MCY0850915.1 signal peptidase I [Sulfuracidifex metallicus]MUN27924.1 signal peptidase I [Sulfuracidifex metallicus DSM 6482 = JCM 9184]WOE51522.1 signal peptidase I [Sulfuracidifex metallicus DSM 6482 = JCM 9184]